jgi:EmrB/QacA subfamily drug resistance transporter
MSRTDAGPPPAVATPGVGLRSERGPVLLALMLSTGLVAIDSTIIATAVPSVVANLGGFAQFPWLFSTYLLAQAVSAPIYGKLADLYGRKPIMLLGVGLFLGGSVLCALAWSMPTLIAFRALQGLGAGAILPMAMTIASDIYSLAERGRVQGYLASVWGISAVVGPTLGGVFSEYVSWRWIFWINMPLCLVAAFVLLRNLREQVTRRSHTLDYAGAALLTVGCALLILGLLEGGVAWSWASLPGIAIPAAGLVLIAVFGLVERRAVEPILPLWVFRRRILVTCNLVSLGVGIVLIGLTSYMPTFVQGVLGFGPLIAGFALATLTIGWPLTASQAGRFYMRLGFRSTALIGVGIVIVGAVLTIPLGLGSSVVTVGIACFVIGAGLGLVAAPILIAAQSTAEWKERGVVTSTSAFSRSMGSAIGVALFGAIANASLGPGPATSAALARASHHVFLAVTGAAVLTGLAVVLFPRKVTPIAESAPASAPQ